MTAMLSALTDVNTFAATNHRFASDVAFVGDVDGSGSFNNLDEQALLNVLKSGGGSLSAVPEPASAVLAALGLIGLAVVGRGKRHSFRQHAYVGLKIRRRAAAMGQLRPAPRRGPCGKYVRLQVRSALDAWPAIHRVLGCRLESSGPSPNCFTATRSRSRTAIQPCPFRPL